MKVFVDFGYMYSKSELVYSQNNTLLYGYGIGVDFVSYYDIVFRVEYSFNKQNEQNLFFHFNKAI